tara:strand:- start:1172 stop:1378 length:207 start_codon:yes stop_codon:yes gene_type:complete
MKFKSSIKIQDKEILLCCGRGRCPSIKRDPRAGDTEHFLLTDDFGGSIKLDKEQLLSIKEAVKNLDAI